MRIPLLPSNPSWWCILRFHALYLLFLSHLLFHIVTASVTSHPDKDVQPYDIPMVSETQPIRNTTTHTTRIAMDIHWEFHNDLEQWGSMSSTSLEDVQADLKHDASGEMRLVFFGSESESESFLDSPPIVISLDPKHTVVIRYRYIGDARYGKIGLKLADDLFANPLDYGTWYHDYIFFPIIGDGKWHTTYAYFHHLNHQKDEDLEGLLWGRDVTQLRLWPITYTSPSNPEETSSFLYRNEMSKWKSKSGQSISMDWIRLVRGPTITQITGCHGEQYSDNVLLEQQNNDSLLYFHTQTHIHTITEHVASSSENNNNNNNNNNNTHHPLLQSQQTQWIPSTDKYKYSRVYNCGIKGGDVITIQGTHLGLGSLTPAQIYIDDQPCTHVQHDVDTPQTKVTCITPPQSSKSKSKSRPKSKPFSNHYSSKDRDSSKFVMVEIRHGMLPGLTDSVPLFRYATQPPKPVNVTLSNVAAR